MNAFLATLPALHKDTWMGQISQRSWMTPLLYKATGMKGGIGRLGWYM